MIESIYIEQLYFNISPIFIQYDISGFRKFFIQMIGVLT